MSRIINQNTEPLFIFDMPDDHLLSETISVKGEKGERGDPTKLSDLTNDTGFITKSVSDLTNYYSKTATDDLLGAKLDKTTFNAYEIPSDFFTGDDTVSGSGSSIALSNTTDAPLKSVAINGATEQNGTPTPSDPIDVAVVTGEQTIAITGTNPQTIIVDLGDMELCKLGDYQDHIYTDGDKWYKRKAIGKMSLANKTGWYISGQAIKLKWSNSGVTDIALSYAPEDATPTAYCSMFGKTKQSNLYNGSTDNGFSMDTSSGLDGSHGVLFRATGEFATASAAQDWFDANDPIIYYAMESAEDEEITDIALISQLNALASARSCKGSTSISVSGDLAASLTVEAFRDGWGGTITGIDNSISAKADKTELAQRPYYFDNVADMKKSDLVAGKYAITAGYYTYGDGGGADYRIVDDSSLADNGATVHALSNGLKAILIVRDNTINVNQFGAKGDGTTNDAPAITKALAYNGDSASIIEFDSAGVYLMSASASIYSNTTVNLNGATIKATNNIAFMNTKDSAATAGYGSIKNFSLFNGTLLGESGHGIHFNIFHGLNCTFENIKFKNCFVDTHVFDLGGCKDILIKNCEFIGNLMTSADSANNYREVIQPDYASHGGFPAWDDDGTVAYDGISTTGLTVDGCVFKKNDDDLYYLNAIGTHATSGTNPHSNILIQNCEFYGAQKANIRLPYFENVTIKNNKFYGLNTSRSSGSESALNFNSVSGQTTKCSKLTIVGNYYESVSGDDQVFISVLANSSYPAEDITVKDNRYIGWSASSSAQGQDFSDLSNAKRVSIVSNDIIKAKQIVFKTPSGTLDHLTIENNNLTDCMRFVRCANDATVYNVANFHNINNNIDNGETSYNTSSFNNALGFSQDYAFESSSSSDVNLPVDATQFMTINSNNTVSIPAFLTKFKISGALTVEPSSDGLIRLRVRVWDNITSAYAVDKMSWAQLLANKKCTLQLPTTIVDNSDMRAPATTDPLTGRYSVKVVISYSHNMTIDSVGTDINVSGI